ncbi:MAG: nitroreductase [Gammaproteobacteria bacterium]
MNVSEALLRRKSTRAFLDRTVEPEKIERILNAARHAPSGVNSQPWQVAIVAGRHKLELQRRLEQAFRDGIKQQGDYPYYPEQWLEPYRSRRKACGLQLYGALAIGRDDKQRQMDQWAANYRAFDAPVMLLFFIDPVMEKGSYIDYGMFLQSIMLMAVEEGLSTCPQAALAEYPGIVKETLGYPSESILLCGMAMGYEDADAPVNGYRTPREDIDTFAHFFG